jgi:catechol 2,3-dioxygenase-like lactoylglutathione lyase family enzyme
MQPRMSMITLGVDDLTRAIDFYQNGLGFPRHGDGDDVAFFNLNGTWLGLFSREALAEDAGVDADGTGFNSFAISHNVQSREEVDSVMSQALAAGGKLVKPPQETSWGGYSGYFRDNDGHLWELAHNPFTWIGPSDDP